MECFASRDDPSLRPLYQSWGDALYPTSVHGRARFSRCGNCDDECDAAASNTHVSILFNLLFSNHRLTNIHTNRGSLHTCSVTSNFIVDNMTTGFDLYSKGSRTRKILFSIPSTQKQRIIKSVLFAEAGKIVVGGSDHGKAYVFGVNPGELLETLSHGDQQQLIQAIGVCAFIVISYLNLTSMP